MVSFVKMTRGTGSAGASSYWCFTLNNPTLSDIIGFSGDDEKWSQHLIYIFAALETGESGTKHYQGYLELNRHKDLAWIKRCLPRAHLEKRKGTARQALEYCMKDIAPDIQATIATSTTDNLLDAIVMLEDSESLPLYITWHTRDTSSACILAQVTKPKTRKEVLLEMKLMVDEGKSEMELANHDFSVYVACFRGLDRYRLLTTKPRNHAMEVIVIQGPTETGKSRWVMDRYPDAYWKQQQSIWWDGYASHETVMMDEFYGWLPFSFMLRLLDRYPMMVESKGGQIQFVAKRIIITTNAIPDNWYKPPCYFASLARRVSKWIIMPTLGEAHEYDSHMEARHHFVNDHMFSNIPH